jgi:UDPglucose--hexose-1-phosphate uridylyltransferase
VEKMNYNEIRRDPIMGRWVIVDTTRPRIPETFEREERDLADPGRTACPFCSGNEHMTPREILAYREAGSAPDKSGWWIRVFPSKNPLLRIEGRPERVAVGMYDMHPGVGAHEVFVETPEHGVEFHDLPDGQLEKVLWAYRDRIHDLHKDHRLRYVLIYKNKGYAAGGSVFHAHSQLIASPITPRTVRRELEGARSYYNFNNRERCVWCDMIKAEIDFGRRVILDTGRVIAFCPYASRFPFETWILPVKHEHDYTQLGKELAIDLARAMKSVLTRIERALDSPSYNFVLHASPNPAPREGHWMSLASDFHWHFEFIPRLTRVKGFEWGTGYYVNPTPPEMAAEILRSINA